jgi:hypothetical protein
MRILAVSVLLASANLATTACNPRGTIGTDGGGATRLSEVSINIPTKDKLPALFGGPNCPEIKLKPEELTRLGTTDSCEAAARLIDGYKLTIAQAKCEDGVTGTNKTLTGKASGAKPGDKIVKGCSYDVLLELGEVESNKIYYSNGHASKANLDVPKNAPASIQLKLELMVTTLGVTIGFPKTEKIITDTDSDLSIDINFGRNGTSPTPGAQLTAVRKIEFKEFSPITNTDNTISDALFVANKAIVIKSAADLQKYSSAAATIAVDFSKHMIVGYAMNASSAGVNLSIVNMTKSASEIVIEMMQQNPSDGAATVLTPVGSFAVIEKSDLPVSLKLNTSTTPDPGTGSVPSFQLVNDQILSKKCGAACHGPSAPAPRSRFVGNEAEFRLRKDAVKARTAADANPAIAMPKAPTPALTAEERQLIQSLVGSY